jgi:hypothetical protein
MNNENISMGCSVSGESMLAKTAAAWRRKCRRKYRQRRNEKAKKNKSAIAARRAKWRPSKKAASGENIENIKIIRRKYQ